MDIPQSIRIDNRTFSGRDLVDKVDAVLGSRTAPVWEKDAYRFMGEWVSPAPDVTLTTSGSTGEPKTISVPKERMVASARATIQALALRPETTALLCLPVRYVAAKMFIVRAFVCGFDLSLVKPSLNPMADFSGHVDFTAMTPPQLDATLAHGQLGRIGLVIVGGASLSERTMQALQNVETTVVATYGMTETLSHIALRNVNGPRRSPWYTALADVDLRADERGCLVVYAPRVSVEPVVTNDSVEFAGPGRFVVLGRLENVINSGGIKLFPEAIEEKIRPFLGNRVFFVHGIADEKFGVRPGLFIEGDPFDLPLTDAFAALSRYERIATVNFVPRFAFTESGKIKRNETAQP